jgi:rod shape-determining protein MreB and related proteins
MEKLNMRQVQIEFIDLDYRTRKMHWKDFYKFARKFATEPVIAIDLGTANIRLYVHGRGLVLSEPSLVKIDFKTGLIKSVGIRALENSSFKDSDLFSPLHEGVIVNVDHAISLLKPLVERSVKKLGHYKKPKALVCTPSDVTQQELMNLVDATILAGISSVAVVPEPLAAAIGAGIDTSSGYSQMLIDIGDGITDIVLIKSGALVKSGAIRVACSNIHRSIETAILENYGIELQYVDVRLLTEQLGLNVTDSEIIVINGRDCRSKEDKEIEVQADEILQAINPVTNIILKNIKEFLRNLPDSIACEVIESGIHLTGGGACLPGLAERIEKETSITVHRTADPLNAVIDGARQIVVTGLNTDLWKTQGYS